MLGKLRNIGVAFAVAVPFVMAAAFASYCFWVVLLRVRGEIVAGKIRGLRLRQVHG